MVVGEDCSTPGSISADSLNARVFDPLATGSNECGIRVPLPVTSVIDMLVEERYDDSCCDSERFLQPEKSFWPLSSCKSFEMIDKARVA